MDSPGYSVDSGDGLEGGPGGGEELAPLGDLQRTFWEQLRYDNLFAPPPPVIPSGCRGSSEENLSTP